MIAFVLVSLVSAVYFYIGAFKAGLNARRWALGGLVFGPFLFPMYNISKHVAWRKAVGFGNVTLGA